MSILTNNSNNDVIIKIENSSEKEFKHQTETKKKDNNEFKDSHNNEDNLNSNNVKKIDIKIITKKQKITQDLLRKMLSYFNISFININDLINIELERNSFLTPEVVDHFQKFKEEFKILGYKTGKLTSLHKNNLIKQKFPAINMLRQLLKCNNLLLKPLIKSNGYDKITGRKNTIRYFIIKEK